MKSTALNDGFLSYYNKLIFICLQIIALVKPEIEPDLQSLINLFRTGINCIINTELNAIQDVSNVYQFQKKYDE